jgi:hypothetical protein
MTLEMKKYELQKPSWPQEGRHIMAQYDEQTIVVYQAYRPAIGRYAAEHQCFGGEFSYQRMSWIKRNFLWMMYRCGWGVKEGQEVVLAVRIQRTGFDAILNQAVHSSYVRKVYPSRERWKDQLNQSSVRLQWDPDHDPHGNSCERRAIQLGLRGEVLKQFGTQWIVSIKDISTLVANGRQHVQNGQLQDLEMPKEKSYPIEAQTASRLGMNDDE